MAGPEVVVVVDDSSDEEEVEEPGPPLNVQLRQEGNAGLDARMHQALREVFKLRAFRPPQQAVVKHVLQGGSGLVLLPTGGGKSLCYQLPAVLLEGVCLVVSPLIALMEDQVAALRAKGVDARACR